MIRVARDRLRALEIIEFDIAGVPCLAKASAVVRPTPAEAPVTTMASCATRDGGPHAQTASCLGNGPDTRRRDRVAAAVNQLALLALATWAAAAGLTVPFSSGTGRMNGVQ
jgi:hypothetical protein